MSILFCLFALSCFFCINNVGGDLIAWGIISSTLLVILVISMILWPISYMVELNNIEEFKAVEKTLPIIRDTTSEFENFRLNEEIIEQNKWLATAQYWNKTIFDTWIPDEVDNLKPLK